MSLKSHSLVEVEPSIYTISRGEESALIPLKERRGGWGFTVGAGGGYYSPKHYDPNFITDSYENTYGSGTPMMDVQLQVKKNFTAMSFGVDLGIGFYSTSSTAKGLNSTVSFNPARLGGTVILDGFFSVPYVAPYGTLGMYTNFYRESQGAVTFGGNTQLAVYYAFGGLFLLDWLDPKSADQAYSESSLQATYIYVEGRQYMKSGNESDPDLSTGLDPNLGLRLEF